MKTIDRYLISHILGLTAIVALALLAIHTFVTFVAEIDEVGQGAFGFAELALYIIYQMPSGLLTLLPIIAMLGTLMGLGHLATQSELTAMRAAGVSLLRIGGATLLAGALLAVLSLVLADWAAPMGQVRAAELRSQAKYGFAPGIGGKAVWLRRGPNVYRIERLLAEDHMQNVRIYSFGPDQALAEVAAVADARFEGAAWQLRGIDQTLFHEDRVEARHLETDQWAEGPAPDVLRQLVLEAGSLTARGLLRLIAYLEANQQDTYPYRLSLWRKLISPVTVMAMMLLAVPFVLGTVRDAGAGMRLLIGVLIGLSFYVLNEVVISIGEIYRWAPAIVASLPTGVVLVVASWRLARTR